MTTAMWCLWHYVITSLTKNVSTKSEQNYAGFRLACRSPLRRVIITCCFRVAALSGHAALAFSPSGNCSRVEKNSTVCDLPRWAKWQGYWSIGKTLLAAWSSLCGKWRLRSCTNIIIKAAMRRAAREFEISITLLRTFEGVTLVIFETCCHKTSDKSPGN